MSARDDGPVHSNFDGISFNLTTDRRGVVVHPASGQTRFPLTYLTLDQAADLQGQLEAIKTAALAHDAQSYVAAWVDGILEDLGDALNGSSRP